MALMGEFRMSATIPWLQTRVEKYRGDSYTKITSLLKQQITYITYYRPASKFPLPLFPIFSPPQKVIKLGLICCVRPSSRRIGNAKYQIFLLSTKLPKAKRLTSMIQDYSIKMNILYVIIQCLNLPKKPWLLTIGGMPLWITSSTTEIPE